MDDVLDWMRRMKSEGFGDLEVSQALLDAGYSDDDVDGFFKVVGERKVVESVGLFTLYRRAVRTRLFWIVFLVNSLAVLFLVSLITFFVWLLW